MCCGTGISFFLHNPSKSENPSAVTNAGEETEEERKESTVEIQVKMIYDRIVQTKICEIGDMEPLFFMAAPSFYFKAVVNKSRRIHI